MVQQAVLELPLDEELLKVLSSDTRREILRLLTERRMTGSELAQRLDLGKPAVAEHLKRLTDAALILRLDDPERKWVYYELAPRGRSLLEPARVRFYLVLGVAALALLLGVALAFALQAVLGALGDSGGGSSPIEGSEGGDLAAGNLERSGLPAGSLVDLGTASGEGHTQSVTLQLPAPEAPPEGSAAASPTIPEGSFEIELDEALPEYSGQEFQELVVVFSPDAVDANGTVVAQTLHSVSLGSNVTNQESNANLPADATGTAASESTDSPLDPSATPAPAVTSTPVVLPPQRLSCSTVTVAAAPVASADGAAASSTPLAGFGATVVPASAAPTPTAAPTTFIVCQLIQPAPTATVAPPPAASSLPPSPSIAGDSQNDPGQASEAQTTAPAVPLTTTPEAPNEETAPEATASPEPSLTETPATATPNPEAAATAAPSTTLVPQPSASATASPLPNPSGTAVEGVEGAGSEDGAEALGAEPAPVSPLGALRSYAGAVLLFLGIVTVALLLAGAGPGSKR
ncbi:MAG TPA: helix-turn-helix domain-containing protein [Candidatus Thermoplasmatota archaeon]|nr:helix-turn-helix domain-containing protein [Candidatus Thermoplasmatota archaeon]